MTHMINVGAGAAMAQWAVVVRLGIRLGWRDLRAVREPPLHPHKGRDARFPPTRERRGPEPSSSPSPSGRRDLPRLRGNDGCFRVNDACDQCKGWGGDGAMGSCRWIGDTFGMAWTFGRFANRPYIHTGSRDARFPPTRERRGPEPSSSPSPSGRRDLPRLRRDDG